jgi:hypothetical protein
MAGIPFFRSVEKSRFAATEVRPSYRCLVEDMGGDLWAAAGAERAVQSPSGRRLPSNSHLGGSDETSLFQFPLPIQSRLNYSGLAALTRSLSFLYSLSRKS